MNFYQLLEAKIESEAKERIKKLPKKHQDLIKGYKFNFENNSSLKKHPDAVGLIHLNDPKKKKIEIASPWNYGREFAMFHEVGHIVWQDILTDEQKEKWKEVAKKNKNRIKQNTEELFCHAYANFYSDNKIEKHTHPEWEKFMKNAFEK